MKHNLKTIKKQTNIDAIMYEIDMFEVELREKIKEFGQQPVYLEDVIKEILGK